MKKLTFLFFICIVSGFLNASEPSVFEAGDLDSASPYGLTEDEKKIYQNKQEIQNLKKEISLLKNEVSVLKDAVEGLRSVITSYSDTIGELKSKYASFDVNASSQQRGQIEERLKALEENDKKIEQTLKELAKLIASSNTSSKSKNALSTTPKKLSLKELYKEALKAYRRHDYDKAEALFLDLVAKNYRPAICNFYLGEINYYRRNYKEAVVFYKKSIQLYDQASYIPTLLLHTGISFKKIGDNENAEKIFNALIGNYPNSKEAKIAKKYL
ncbi:MAG: tetratricopeptide repeat protein [Epsilonproteobacteria bacterium]|nr:tetratricopeptide repeat protein [Campylobacterota bacterium]